MKRSFVVDRSVNVRTCSRLKQQPEPAFAVVGLEFNVHVVTPEDVVSVNVSVTGLACAAIGTEKTVSMARIASMDLMVFPRFVDLVPNSTYPRPRRISPAWGGG